ncbi:signal transduction protein with CBS domains [Halorubrum sp. AJ67]|nr:signal transduction protein with CBS domains [Halorubrum sp. AJ67]
MIVPRTPVELGMAKTAQKEGLRVVESVEIVDSITVDLIAAVVT